MERADPAGEAFHAGIKRGTCAAIPVGVEDHDPTVVTAGNVITDGEQASARRKPYMTHPSLGGINHIV
jgi:uncharacterized protein YhfF